MSRSGADGRAPVSRRYHFHAPGVIYVGVTLFLAVGAINSQNNLLFAALGLAIGGLLVSGIISGACLLGVRVERDAIPYAAAGAPLSVSYTITNSNRFFPAFGLCILELPTGDAGGWQDAMPVPTAFVAYIAARKSVRVEAVVVPFHRGRAALKSVRVWTTFPFGLTRKSVTFDQPATCLVRPVELPLRRSLIEEITSPAPYGDGAERRPGQGQEFFALREYSPGDNPRRISWRRSARTGDLVVRQEAVPAPRRLWVVLQPLRPDGSSAQGQLLERAVALAAAFVRAGASTGMAVGLLTPGLFHPPRTGSRHTELLICDLATFSGGGELDLAPALGRSGGCVIISAGAPPPAALAARGRTLHADDLESFVAVERSGDRLSLLAPDGPTSSSGRPMSAEAAA